MPAKVVSIINLKGGVGKSTLTMILGEYLAFRFSHNVLLIDMDAQANLSYCMLPERAIQTQEREGRTVYHVFQDAFRGERLDISDYITQPPLVVSNVARSAMFRHETDIHMVVSTPSVAQLDADLLDLWESGEPAPNRIRETLADALAPVMDRYSYILIDCPPGLSIFSSAALMASDYYIAPMIPEPLSLQGIELVSRRVDNLRRAYGAKVEFKGSVLNIVKHYRNTHSSVSQTLYTKDASRYLPFQFWLPDNEKIRKLGEFDPDVDGTWAMGATTKFSDLHQKYGLSYRLTNPSSGVLSRQGAEGPEYRLQDRIRNLVEEFQAKCVLQP